MDSGAYDQLVEFLSDRSQDLVERTAGRLYLEQALLGFIHFYKMILEEYGRR